MSNEHTEMLRLPTTCIPTTCTSTTASDSDYEANRPRFGEEINRGGSGVILRADKGLVVKTIKLMLNDTMFQNEVDIMKSIKGRSNIVELIESQKEDNIGLIFMKEYQGDLKQLLDRNQNGFNEAVVKSFMKQLLAALNVCQDAFIVHGDVKPENILIDYHNDDEVPLDRITLLLTDFGSARNLEHDIENATFKATWAYQSPETLSDPMSSVKADSWAAGITMYQLMTGRLPDPVRAIKSVLSNPLMDPPITFFKQIVWDNAIDALKEGYSENCCAVLRGLLTIDDALRISSKEALQFAWFENHRETKQTMPVVD